MDGWQLPLAPEQAFSLALAQERVGVMQFAAPSEAMTMNFAPVVIGAKGETGATGITGHCLTLALDAAQIAAKQIVLPAVALSEVLVSIIGGTTQKQNIDFTVSGAVLSWSGLSLELLLAVGDCLSISYF